MSVEQPQPSLSPREREEAFWQTAAGILKGNKTHVVLYEKVSAAHAEFRDLTNARDAMFAELGGVRIDEVVSERVDMENGYEYTVVSREVVPSEWPSVRAVSEAHTLVVKTAYEDRYVVTHTAFLYRPRG